MNNTQKPGSLDPEPWAREKGISSPEQNRSNQDEQDGDDAGASRETTPPPNSLFEFVRQFYIAKAVVGEKYREYFKDLDANLTNEQQDELYNLAVETDREYTKTLSLAEFVLETPGKRNQRDQIMHVVQRVASNAGHLAQVPSNAVFQLWLDNNSAIGNKLDFFFGQIEQITDGKDNKGKDKKLGLKARNNLGCIAAMWLYYKDQANLTQLIGHLMKSGMNLQGEAGPLVESRAFAFVASMIKSTNKKKFAYFVDYVGRNEGKLTDQYRNEVRRNSELSRKLSILNDELDSGRVELDKSHEQLCALQQEYGELQKKKSEMEQTLQHTSIHHDADLQSTDSKYHAVLQELMDTLELAKTAFSRGPDKTHILEYQLEELERLIRKELK